MKSKAKGIGISVVLSAGTSGAAAMILEIAGIHALAPGFGTSIYTWTAMISVALGSLAIGYMLGGYFASGREESLATHVLPSTLAIASLGLAFDAFLWHGIVLSFATHGPRFGAVVSSIALFALPFTALGAVYPVCMRIWTQEVREVGSRAGILSAASAAGSLGGTAWAGFVLVPKLLMEQIFSGCSAALLLASATVLVIARGSKAAAAVAISMACLVTLIPSSLRESDVPYSRLSRFGPVDVVDRGDALFLVVSGAIQGGMWKKPRTSVFEYVQEIGGALRANLSFPDAKVLLIGLGAGLIPRELEPGSVTTVEVDSVILETARDCFTFDSDLYPVIIGDGRSCLHESETEYDAIVLDAYGGGNHPFHLLTREFFELARNRLRSDGFLLVNFQGFLRGDGALFARCLEKTLRVVFEEVLVKVPEGGGEFANVVFVACGVRRHFSWPSGGGKESKSFLDGDEPAFELIDSRNAIDLWNAAIEGRWRIESARTLGRRR